jgi:cytochrome c556
MRFPLLAATAIALILPSLAVANEAVTARKAQFALYAYNLGILAPMAQGRVPYDAERAQTAADTLFHLTRIDQGPLWPEGTDNATIEGTRALPMIWSDLEGFTARYSALQDAAVTLQGVAGTDLASLQGALGPFGGACGACHQQFRAP